jgi:hypothetical protein
MFKKFDCLTKLICNYYYYSNNIIKNNNLYYSYNSSMKDNTYINKWNKSIENFNNNKNIENKQILVFKNYKPYFQSVFYNDIILRYKTLVFINK